MKKLIYISFFFALTLIVVSCEKEVITPEDRCSDTFTRGGTNYCNPSTNRGGEDGDNDEEGGGIVDPDEDEDFGDNGEGITDPDEDEDFDAGRKKGK